MLFLKRILFNKAPDVLAWWISYMSSNDINKPQLLPDNATNDCAAGKLHVRGTSCASGAIAVAAAAIVRTSWAADEGDSPVGVKVACAMSGHPSQLQHEGLAPPETVRVQPVFRIRAASIGLSRPQPILVVDATRGCKAGSCCVSLLFFHCSCCCCCNKISRLGCLQMQGCILAFDLHLPPGMQCRLLRQRPAACAA